MVRYRLARSAHPGIGNEIWVLDFMTDTLYSTRAFRTLNVIDEGNREALGIEVAHSIPALRVIRVMEQLIELYGKPLALQWTMAANSPRPPSPNGVSNEVPDAYVFESIDQVRAITEDWAARIQR